MNIKEFQKICILKQIIAFMNYTNMGLWNCHLFMLKLQLHNSSTQGYKDSLKSGLIVAIGEINKVTIEIIWKFKIGHIQGIKM